MVFAVPYHDNSVMVNNTLISKYLRSWCAYRDISRTRRGKNHAIPSFSGLIKQQPRFRDKGHGRNTSGNVFLLYCRAVVRNAGARVSYTATIK